MLLPDSDFCDHCGRPLSPAATLGWATGGDHFQSSGEARTQLKTFDAPVKENLPSVAGSPAAGEKQIPSPTAPRLDRYIPEELRQKLDAALSQGGMVGERRVVSMLFCDVKGSTAAAENLDPEDWTEIINGAFEHMIRSVYKYEGTVARLMGDGILAFFGAPIAHEDDPQRAVLAGLDIVEGIAGYRGQVGKAWGIDIDVRVGINTGLVVVGTVGSDLRMEYSAMGDAINLAARMEQTAEPGTVQIAYDTYKLVKFLFDVEDLGGITIKGKADPVPVYRVLGRKAKVGRQRGIEGLQATLVGRDHELSTLKDILSTVQQGVGHIACLIGEAGMGKSRLVYEAKRSLENDQSLGWFETASLSYETHQPYAPFQRLIRRLNDINPGDSAVQVQEKLAALGYQFDESKGQRTQRVFEALFDLESDGEARLEGEAFKRELYEIMPALWRERFSRQPTVLVFDDIHWSDPASIELLLHLFPLTAELPLVLLCAFRPERHGPVWQIKTTADDEFHHCYTEITMRPLSNEQVNELIDRLLINADIPQSLRERIVESAAGNPFFVEEVVRSLIDSHALVAEQREQDGQRMLYWHATGNGRQIDIPDNLQSLLATRIDRLEEATRHILQTAAVIGRSFYRRVLEAIEVQSTGTELEVGRQLTQLLQLEMIREAARMPELEYKFSNPLTQEVAYQTILLKRRRELHCLVGQALEKLFPNQLGELAPLLAYHFSEGDLKEKAFDYYIMAGDSAARLFANIEAVDHYTRALTYVGSVDPGYEKLEALFTHRGRALELLSRYEDSLDNYQAMLQLARDRGDKRLELAAKMAQATIRSISSQVFDAEISLQLSEDTLKLAHELGEYSAEAKIHWNMMLYYLWAQYDFDNAVVHGEAASNIARDSDLIEELGPILNDLGTAYFGVGRLDDALHSLAEAKELLREGNVLPLLALNLTNTAFYQYLVGENELAIRLMDESEQIDRSIENYWGLAGDHYYRGLIYLNLGRWGEAYSFFKKACVFGEKANTEPILAGCFGGQALYCNYVGTTDVGLEFCKRAMPILEKHLPLIKGYPWGIMSHLYLTAGDLASAQDALEISLASLDLDKPPTPTLSSIDVRLAEIRVRLAEGQPDLALARADDLLDYLNRYQTRQYLPEALLLKAKALLVLDQPKGADDILTLACREAEELSNQPSLWQILDTLADALERLGDPEQATSKRDKARAILTILADSILEDEDRATFLSLPDVRRLLADQE